LHHAQGLILLALESFQPQVMFMGDCSQKSLSISIAQYIFWQYSLIQTAISNSFAWPEISE